MSKLKRTWRWDPESRSMVEIDREAPSAPVNAPMVHGDFKPLSVGGVVIEDRGHLRRYLKANDLVPYDPGAAKQARDRIERNARDERKKGVVNAFEHARNQERARKRFG